MLSRSLIATVAAALSVAAVSVPARADSYYIVDLAYRIETQAQRTAELARAEGTWDSNDRYALNDLQDLAYEAQTFRQAIERYPDQSYLVRGEFNELSRAAYQATRSIRDTHFSWRVFDSLDDTMRSFYEMERFFDGGYQPPPPPPYPGPHPGPYPPYPPHPGPGPVPPPHPYPGPGPGPHPGPYPGPGPGHPGPGHPGPGHPGPGHPGPGHPGGPGGPFPGPGHPGGPFPGPGHPGPGHPGPGPRPGPFPPPRP